MMIEIMEEIGAAKPIKNKDDPEIPLRRIVAGIRTPKEVSEFWIMLNMAWPVPLKYPPMLKIKQVRRQSQEYPFK